MRRMHELHEVAVHAQDDEHLKLLVAEQRIALGQHMACAAEDALAVGLRIERSDLAVGRDGHQRDQAVQAAILVRLHDLVAVERADVQGHA